MGAPHAGVDSRNRNAAQAGRNRPGFGGIDIPKVNFKRVEGIIRSDAGWQEHAIHLRESLLVQFLKRFGALLVRTRRQLNNMNADERNSSPASSTRFRQDAPRLAFRNAVLKLQQNPSMHETLM
jgi:hypothetical protein